VFLSPSRSIHQSLSLYFVSSNHADYRLQCIFHLGASFPSTRFVIRSHRGKKRGCTILFASAEHPPLQVLLSCAARIPASSHLFRPLQHRTVGFVISPSRSVIKEVADSRSLLHSPSADSFPSFCLALQIFWYKALAAALLMGRVAFLFPASESSDDGTIRHFRHFSLY
jgi:hypothetical protein